MADAVIGATALQHRLVAISAKTGVARMTLMAAAVRGEMVSHMPRKTGTTAGSLTPRAITPVSAQVWGSPVAVWLDTGTGLYGPLHRRITPKAARVLAFHWSGAAPAGAKTRLTGRMTAASVRRFGSNADLVVVRSVKGMEARPYIAKAMEQASMKVGVVLEADIIREWNGAA